MPATVVQDRINIKVRQWVAEEDATTTQVSVVRQETVKIVELGRQGPPGIQGPIGPGGPPGGAVYQHDQVVPATTWTIVHNLNKWPLHVSAFDTTDRQTWGSIQKVDANTIEVVFNSARAGTARVS